MHLDLVEIVEKDTFLTLAGQHFDTLLGRVGYLLNKNITLAF